MDDVTFKVDTVSVAIRLFIEKTTQWQHTYQPYRGLAELLKIKNRSFTYRLDDAEERLQL